MGNFNLVKLQRVTLGVHYGRGPFPPVNLLPLVGSDKAVGWCYYVPQRQIVKIEHFGSYPSASDVINLGKRGQVIN